MKVLLIDNDDTIREGLKKLLQKYCPQVSEISEANGVVNGLEKIASIKPDIVFLDVEMDDGTGFDLIQQLDKFNFALIFITAYNKYAVTAFKFSAIDFLEKPIDPLELVVSINKAIENLKKTDLEQQIKVLEENIQNIHFTKSKDKKIALHDGQIIHYIKVNDVIYCKADGAYTKFFLVDSISITVSKNLKEYDELLSDFGFLRTHHSILINTSKIVKFDRTEGGNLWLEENHNVLVSVRKKEQVLEMLGKL